MSSYSFPQHPHRGFETITTTVMGHCDHSDSLSNSGRFGNGDTMFLTAGAGIAHAEVFPLIHPDQPNTLKLFQIWLNLPRKSKLKPPHFDMHWAENVKTVTTDATGGAYCRLYIGGLGNETNNCPIPPASWAKDPKNDVGVFVIVLPPGGSKFILPPCQYGNEINRYAYLTEGKGVKVSGTKIPAQKYVDLHGNMSVEFVNLHPEEQAEILILQGRPINEPIAQRGPFVMNTNEELAESFSEYRRGKFGQWPWPKDAMAFPRNKGRFASYALGNGKFREDRPPTEKETNQYSSTSSANTKNNEL